jgi:hypothetical protein
MKVVQNKNSKLFSGRRNSSIDRRKSWVRVSQWSSVYVDPDSSPESS